MRSSVPYFQTLEIYGWHLLLYNTSQGCNSSGKNSHNSDHMVSKVITSFWVKKRVGQLGVKDEKSLVERKSS